MERSFRIIRWLQFNFREACFYIILRLKVEVYIENRMVEDCSHKNNMYLGKSQGNRAKQSISITDCQFINNSAQMKGGAIFLDQETLAIGNTIFLNGHSIDGGVLYFIHPSIL